MFPQRPSLLLNPLINIGHSLISGSFEGICLILELHYCLLHPVLLAFKNVNCIYNAFQQIERDDLVSLKFVNSIAKSADLVSMTIYGCSSQI